MSTGKLERQHLFRLKRGNFVIYIVNDIGEKIVYCIPLLYKACTIFFFRNQLRKYSPHQRIAGWITSGLTSSITSRSMLFNHFFHRMVYFLFSIKVLYHKLSALNKAFDGVCGVVKKFLIKVGKDAYFFLISW